MTLLTTAFAQGTHAARPAAASSNNGFYYYETDTTNLFQSTGSAWQQIASTGGTGSGGLVRLFDSTLAIAAASIDTGAGGIASGHSHLTFMIVAQSTKAAVSDQLNLTFNNDTGANYDRAVIYEASGTPGGVENFAQGALQITIHANGGSLTGYPGVITGWVPAYDQTTFYKQGTMQGGLVDPQGGASLPTNYQWGYRSTTAISRMAIAAAGGNLAAGSRLTVYGTS